MAVELRLGPPEESLKDILVQHRENFESSVYNDNYFSIVENMRTFVACYYISSWYAPRVPLTWPIHSFTFPIQQYRIGNEKTNAFQVQ